MLHGDPCNLMYQYARCWWKLDTFALTHFSTKKAPKLGGEVVCSTWKCSDSKPCSSEEALDAYLVVSVLYHVSV